MINPLAPPGMPPPIQAKIDAQLEALWPQIQAEEDAYYAAHACYWQGLLTHQEQLPNNGDDVLPDVGELTPTDQPDPWPPALIADPIAAALVIDAYGGPLGQGYVLHAVCNIAPAQTPPQARTRWERALNVGPETWRTFDWQSYQPPTVPLG